MIVPEDCAMPTQYPELNPRSRGYYRRRAKRRRREEAQWAARSGPVTVRQGSAVECSTRDPNAPEIQPVALVEGRARDKSNPRQGQDEG